MIPGPYTHSNCVGGYVILGSRQGREGDVLPKVIGFPVQVGLRA